MRMSSKNFFFNRNFLFNFRIQRAYIKSDSGFRRHGMYANNSKRIQRHGNACEEK